MFYRGFVVGDGRRVVGERVDMRWRIGVAVLLLLLRADWRKMIGWCRKRYVLGL